MRIPQYTSWPKPPKFTDEANARAYEQAMVLIEPLLLKIVEHPQQEDAFVACAKIQACEKLRGQFPENCDLFATLLVTKMNLALYGYCLNRENEQEGEGEGADF